VASWLDTSPPNGGAAAGAELPSWPPPGWPSKSQLDYTRTLIVVLLLLLAVPWLVMRLLTNPGAVIEGLGKGVVRKGAA